MGDEKRRMWLGVIQLEKKILNHHFRQRVESTKRLVHQQHFRLSDYCPNDLDTAPHSRGHITWIKRLDITKAYTREHIDSDFVCLLRQHLLLNDRAVTD